MTAISAVRAICSPNVGPIDSLVKSAWRTALIAVIASLFLISIYIGLRFEFKYAVPVLIALSHDILITAGVYALTDREVSTATVAALLTILGYSLYDTIIVFDRVRENVPRMPRATFSQIVNRSMSEVVVRSLATSFSTLMPVTALLLFGGETLKDFAFALLVGIASGTYSSIFIATPVLWHWKEREPVWVRRRLIVMDDHGGVVPAYAEAQLGEDEEMATTARPAAAGPRARRAAGRAGRERAAGPRASAEGRRETPPPDSLEELDRAQAPPDPEPEPEAPAEETVQRSVLTDPPAGAGLPGQAAEPEPPKPKRQPKSGTRSRRKKHGRR